MDSVVIGGAVVVVVTDDEVEVFAVVAHRGWDRVCTFEGYQPVFACFGAVPWLAGSSSGWVAK